MPKDHLLEVGPNLQKLSPDRLYTDGGTQPRGQLDDVEVAVGPTPIVRVRDGARLLVEIPAKV